MTKGQIRVGTITSAYGKRIYPKFDGFKGIRVLTKSSTYGEIGPYVATVKRNIDGIDVDIVMENAWQFSKYYDNTPKVRERVHQYTNEVAWERDSEDHTDLDTYWKWRSDGFKCEHPVRYPVGRKFRHKCKFAVEGYINKEVQDNIKNGKTLDYVESRKQLYLPLYIESVSNQPRFKKLKRWLNEGKNLLIIEVDGPIEESLDYYKQKYGVKDDFIEDNTILITKDNIKIMLNDTKHPFGHGYCLALALLEKENE